MIKRLEKMEEEVSSLKNATKEIQEKQKTCDEKLKEPSVPKKPFDKVLNDVKILKKNADRFQNEVSDQHKNVDKKVDTLHNMHLKFKKKIHERVNKIKETNGDISSSIDHYFETVTEFDSRLKSLEDKNKSVNVSVNELNKQISSVRTCSNDALMSIQDLSKSVESTNQHYNEMSDKMNQMEISINLMSAQYTEQLENMKSHNQDKFEDLIGVVCQLVVKRLAPMEVLKKALNTVSTTKAPLTLKREDAEKRYVHLSERISEMESKPCLPEVGFYVSGYFNLTVGTYIFKQFRAVHDKYKIYFEERSGRLKIPFTGLYLISIRAELAKNNSIAVQYIWEYPLWCISEDNTDECLCRLTGNQPITVCCHLKAGGDVFLKMNIREENSTFIDFSCVLINK
ncbi:unnamed protein product [Lymnaea stagnalis]|uniref:C1q domain-containing protein n=1 Tax=Lymnaea stagnalis TaxID=6523 RepID=A0AAV2HU33_LYMST